MKETNNATLSWERVEAYVKENTKGGAAMALIETEKVFGEVLKKLGFPGKNTNTRVNSAKGFISNYKVLEKTRQLTKNLKETIDTELMPNDISEILQVYYKAIRDLTDEKKSKLRIWDKIVMYFNIYVPRPKKTLRNLVIYFLAFFFIIFILDSTKIGNVLVDTLTTAAHFIFNWLLFAIILFIGIGIIIVGSLFYFENRQKSKIKAMEGGSDDAPKDETPDAVKDDEKKKFRFFRKNKK